ncbi:hypothetical protein BJX63DRAFT_417678 [Aspergillus granulosus]|uniref:LysM domain-containing protein n=1 Tax=Aspergillus granulosus TaxID=176169 RepID=A0ABR4I6Z4_9EURO
MSLNTTLASYEDEILNSYSKYNFYKTSGSELVPAAVIPLHYHYYHNKTCIQDGDRWCHGFARKVAKNTLPMDQYNNCLIKQYQFVAGSPLYTGYKLRSSYTALTQQCSKTDLSLPPTSSTSIPKSTNNNYTSNYNWLYSTTYTIQEGDTCQSISKSQTYCSNFPTEGNPCIQNTCTTNIVGPDDSCAALARVHLLTEVQLTTWNPNLGPDCRHIKHSVGNSICLSPPGDNKWSPIIIPSATSTATTTGTPAPVPTDVADGTVDRCAQFLLVQPGDYCNKIIIKYGISLEDFLFLNQDVNQNCTNLFTYKSYCIQPAGPIDEYPGHPGYILPDESITYLPETEFPFATYTPGPITNQTTVLPFAPGTRRDCVLYSDELDMQIDLGASSYDSPCELFADMNNISLDTLSNWNPSLNGSSPDCAFDERYRYCVAPYKTSVTLSPSPTTMTETTTSITTATTTEPPVTTTTTGEPPGPTQSGILENCNKWHLVENNSTLEQLY